MTEKLYWELPYETTFKAKVIGITPEGVSLDNTLFYPQGGGQESDKEKLEKEELFFKVRYIYNIQLIQEIYFFQLSDRYAFSNF